jgi:asparagine synthase (glutamine-hydrolysing)
MNILAEKRWRDLAAFSANIAEVLPAIAGKLRVFFKERRRYFGQAEGMATELVLPELTHSPSPGAGKGQATWKRQVLDITRYSLPTLLRYEDRNSMANSIESRLPFLDHRLIELGTALPTAKKLRRGMGKYVLRQAVRGLVPDRILDNRDKRGFDTRHGDFIYGGLGTTIRSAMKQHDDRIRTWLPEGSTIEEYFSDEAIAKIAPRFAEATTLLWMADPSLESYPQTQAA